METPTLIHKIVISLEAVFDYEEDMELGKIPRRDIKAELEECMQNLRESGRIGELCRYFRVKYFDESTDTMLMMFVYRAERLGLMQLWRVCGVCREEDWNDELEYDGSIRNWLKTSIADLPYEEDWVIAYRKRKEEEEEYQKQCEKEYKKWKKR